MTTYFYQATDTTGKIIEGDIEAPDYSVAAQSELFPDQGHAGKTRHLIFQTMEGVFLSGLFLFEDNFL